MVKRKEFNRLSLSTHNQCKQSAMDPGDEIDNDCDTLIDEEIYDGKDDDDDSYIDEDVKLVIGGWVAYVRNVQMQ